MAFRSGNIVDANPATALVAQIEAEFDAHGNWDLVGTVTIGTNTHRVWKNRGSGTGANAFGQDFHIDLQYNPAGGTTLRIRCFEAYDAVNDKAIRPCVPTGASQAINANGSFGDETNGFTLEATQLVYADILTVTTGFDYYIQVSNDRLCVASKYSTTDTACYAGLFESLMAADPFPLCAPALTVLRRVTGQPIDNGVETPVSWNSETLDELGWFDPANPTVLTADASGIVNIVANTIWNSNSAGVRTSKLTVNNSPVTDQPVVSGGVDVWGRGLIVYSARLAAGDTLRLLVYHNSGATTLNFGRSSTIPAHPSISITRQG